MKVYLFISYSFNGLVYPGIEYMDSFFKTEVEFDLFLQNAQLHVVTFGHGETLHHQLFSHNEFYNGLYKDVMEDQQYMICCVDV